MPRLVCLGASAHSFSTHGTTAMLVESAAGRLLIDCGPDTPRAIRRQDVRLDEVDAVVLTHRHLDHSLGLPYLLVGRGYDAREADRAAPPLEVIATPEDWDTVHRFAVAMQPDVASLDVRLVAADAAVERPVDVCGLRVQLLPADHTVPTYAVLVSEEDRLLIAYSGDTRPSSAFAKHARGATVVVHEAFARHARADFAAARGHSTARQAGEVIAGTGCTEAFLVHFRESEEGHLAEMEREASTAAGRPVRYLRDGEEIVL